MIAIVSIFANESTSVFFYPQLGDLDWLSFPELEPLNYKLFSPLHSQVQSEFELGSSFNAFQAGSSNNSFQVQSQYGTNEVDAYISEFLDSILENPDEAPEKEVLVLQSGFDFDGAAPDQVRGVASKLITSFLVVF